MTGASDLPPLPPVRPRIVQRAVLLECVGILLGAVATMALFTLPRPPPAAMVIGAVIGLLIVAFLVTKILAGRNWARFLLLILFALGVVNLMFSAAIMLAVAPHLLVLTLLQLIVQGGGLVLLFTPRANPWFGPG